MSENVRGPIGETSRHLSTHPREHLVSDRTSHILKHLAYPGHYVIVFLRSSYRYLPLFQYIFSIHRCLPNTKPTVWETCCRVL